LNRVNEQKIERKDCKTGPVGKYIELVVSGKLPNRLEETFPDSPAERDKNLFLLL
jgi:hypothetical protein